MAVAAAARGGRPVRRLKAAPKASRAALDRYARAARRAGVPKPAFKLLARYDLALHERQLEATSLAYACDEDGGPIEVGYGGARSGGKSHWLIVQLTLDCLRFAGLKCLLLRKVGRSNQEAFEDFRLKVLSPVPHDYVAQRGRLRFGNGSFIILGHYQNENDVERYLGLEYDVIAVEEATTLTEGKYVRVIASCRTSKKGWRPRIYSTTNPGGVGHAWYKKRFIAPYRQEKAGKGRQTRTRFLPATVEDNPSVNKENREILDSLTGWLLRAWRQGDWDIESGTYFDEFTPERDGRPWHVVKPFAIPQNNRWIKFGGLDFGTHAPFSFHLQVRDFAGDIWVIDEVYEPGLTPKQQAAKVVECLKRNGVPRNPETGKWQCKVFADPSMFPPKDPKQRVGRYPIEDFWDAGIVCVPAMNSRLATNMNAKEWLRAVRVVTAPGGQQSLQPCFHIFETCENLIRTIPLLICDEKNPDDFDQKQAEDHAVDSCLVAGTGVTTARGMVPIERVVPGDVVLTRGGWRRVLDSAKTGENLPVVTARFSNGATLTGTPSHPVFVEGKGFIGLGKLRYNDSVVTDASEVAKCPFTTLAEWSAQSSTASFTAGTPTPSLTVTAPIFGAVLGTKGSMASTAPCTGMCGLPPMGRFLTGITSTIRTETPVITPWRIWSACPRRSTLPATLSHLAIVAAKRIGSIFAAWKRSGATPKSVLTGTRRPKAVPGILNTLRRLASEAFALLRQRLRSARSLASSAANSTRGRTWGETASVPTPVRPSGDETAALTTLTTFAPSVEERSATIASNLPHSAPLHAGTAHVISVTPAGSADVYNLSVDQDPEFFANGVLVHNCLRYALGSSRIPVPKATVDPVTGIADQSHLPHALRTDDDGAGVGDGGRYE